MTDLDHYAEASDDWQCGAETTVSESSEMMYVRIMPSQQQVYNAVAERGYAEGWTDEQFVGRQIAKLLEEGAEAAECLRTEIVTTPFFVVLARGAGLAAREAFDNNGETWDTAHITDPDKMVGELADVLVVLFCAAEGLSRMTGRKFDIVELAKWKALADVKRGVR